MGILNYGHLIVAMYTYNAFKDTNMSRSKKIKTVVIGTGLIFGWIYLNSMLSIERLEIKRGNELIYRIQKDYDKQEYEDFIFENLKQFKVNIRQEVKNETVGEEVKEKT